MIFKRTKQKFFTFETYSVSTQCMSACDRHGSADSYVYRLKNPGNVKRENPKYQNFGWKTRRTLWRAIWRLVQPVLSRGHTYCVEALLWVTTVQQRCVKAHNVPEVVTQLSDKRVIGYPSIIFSSGAARISTQSVSSYTPACTGTWVSWLNVKKIGRLQFAHDSLSAT